MWASELGIRIGQSLTNGFSFREHIQKASLEAKNAEDLIQTKESFEEERNKVERNRGMKRVR